MEAVVVAPLVVLASGIVLPGTTVPGGLKYYAGRQLVESNRILFTDYFYFRST